MNATDSLLIPLADAGCLNGLKDGALGARYRFWRDEDGLRHVFSVYPADAAPDYPDAIAVVARRTPAGSIAMWAGPAGIDARRASQRLQGDEIHIHVLGETPAPALRRLMDKARPEPARTGQAAQPGTAAPNALTAAALTATALAANALTTTALAANALTANALTATARACPLAAPANAPALPARLGTPLVIMRPTALGSRHAA